VHLKNTQQVYFSFPEGQSFLQVDAVPLGQLFKAQNSIGLVLQQTAGTSLQQLKSLNGPHFWHFSWGAHSPAICSA
jgi:hypothetical protein